MQLFLVIVRLAMLDSFSKIFGLILDGFDGYKQDPQMSHPQTSHPRHSELCSTNCDFPIRSPISLSGLEPLLLLWLLASLR